MSPGLTYDCHGKTFTGKESLSNQCLPLMTLHLKCPNIPLGACEPFLILIRNALVHLTS